MKNRSVDGLRGIAAFNVAVSHFVAAFLPSMLHKNYPSIFAKNHHPSGLFDVLTSPMVSIFITDILLFLSSLCCLAMC